ncbi:MAG: hypothetical protein GKR95_06840 [Gammaproteobacteria bacterium]|nr:hypothetical protein [Gammaproteobacteria bacterium]
MVNGVEKLDQRVLPELDETTSYNVVHDHHEIFNVSRKSGNGCTACHKINAFRESASDSLKMGEINPFAAGSTNILSSARNTIPTKSRYHDFMVGRNSLVANRGTAVKELKKLENCLKMPASTDCIVVPNSSKPTYVIRSKYGCPNHKFCNAELSWDGRTGTHPRASVEFGDRVEWELVEQSTKHYVIKSKYGCPDHKFCDAELSWDGRSGTHPRASVEFNDRVEWELVKKGRSRYTIKNKYRCPNDQFCNAELSWDAVSGSHPMASVEFNDPVEWEIIQKEDAYSKDCNNSSRSYSFGRRSSLVSAPINGKITQPTQTITKIVNLESVDMVLSYFPNTTFFPNAKPIRNIVIPANKGSNKFFITPGYGRVEIERKFEFFQSRGAEIKVCFDH